MGTPTLTKGKSRVVERLEAVFEQNLDTLDISTKIDLQGFKISLFKKDIVVMSISNFDEKVDDTKILKNIYINSGILFFGFGDSNNVFNNYISIVNFIKNNKIQAKSPTGEDKNVGLKHDNLYALTEEIAKDFSDSIFDNYKIYHHLTIEGYFINLDILKIVYERLNFVYERLNFDENIPDFSYLLLKEYNQYSSIDEAVANTNPKELFIFLANIISTDHNAVYKEVCNTIVEKNIDIRLNEIISEIHET
jgi:hypothetical protein